VFSCVSGNNAHPNVPEKSLPTQETLLIDHGLRVGRTVFWEEPGHGLSRDCKTAFWLNTALFVTESGYSLPEQGQTPDF
jgi:hypothetical protein